MSDPVERRRRRVRELAGARLDDARRDALLEGLADPDWRVRAEAVQSVIHCAPEERDPLLPRLVDALAQGENVGLRNAALEALGRLGRRALGPLRDALEARPDGTRKFVIEALGDTGTEEAVQWIAPLVRDADPNISAAALDALARLGGPAAQQILRAHLADAGAYERVAALDGLVRTGAVLPWAELAPLLDDRLARRAALPLFGRSGAPEAIAPLAAALERTPHERSLAVAGLAELAAALGPAALRDPLAGSEEALGEALGEEEGETPRHAAELLLVLRDTERLGAAVAVLARDVLGPNAIAALREWGADASAPLRAVADAATGPARALALELAAELAAAPDAALRTWLWEAAEDEAPAVAAAALRGLGRFAQAEDAPTLVTRASAPGGDLAADAEPAAAATEALRRLAGREREAVEAALAAVDLGHAGPRLPALLAELGGEGALDALQAGLSSEDPALRQACLDALGALGDGRGSDVIAFALMDEDPAVRREAVRALGRVRPLGARAAEGLRQALEDGAPAVRSEAAAALGAHGDAADVPLLAALLDDQPAVAVAAMDALIALAPPDLEAHVERALAHADAEVVKRGLAAALRLPAAAAEARLGAGLSHGSWHVRAAAARLLGELGSGAAMAALEARRAVEEDELVREALDAALAEGGRAGG